MNDMSASEFLFGMFFLSILFLAIIGTLQLFNVDKWKYQQPAHEVITECESTLPRDQLCVLIAIPKEINYE